MNAEANVLRFYANKTAGFTLAISPFIVLQILLSCFYQPLSIATHKHPMPAHLHQWLDSSSDL